jgi:small subunit ribosomal protein S6
MMYILSPELGDENYPAAIEKVNNLISKLGGEVGEINQSAPWGKRRLAYPIKKFNDGFYIVTNLKLTATQTGELERSMRLNEEVLRHLLISLDRD